METLGGGGRVPQDWLKHWPSRAVAPPVSSEPTAWITAGGYCFRPEVKDIIESLAPGVNQFVPLFVEAGPKTDRQEFPYYSIIITDRVDVALPEKSHVRWREQGGLRWWTKRLDSPLVLPAASIVGKHIWWNQKAHISLMSGELYDMLTEHGVTSGLTFQKQIVE